MANNDSEFGGADGFYGNARRSSRLDPYRAVVALRQSGRGVGVDARGVAIPSSPVYGESTRVG